MGRPRRIDEARLLGAARAVFIARGAGASTRAIAEAAGVSQGLLFQRFGTKQQLFFAAMLPQPPLLDKLIGPMPQAASARTYLVGLAARLLRWIDAAIPGSLRAALHPAFPDALDRTHSPGGTDRIADAIAKRIRQLQRDEAVASKADAAATAASLLALLHGDALFNLLSGRRGDTIEARAERAITVLWDGLDPRPPTDARRSHARVHARAEGARAPYPQRPARSR